MSTIVVQNPGMFTTVQDLGRPGYGPLGVSRSGAADPVSLRIGNLLVGNPEGAAALEMTMLGGTFEFPDGGVVALAGSDFGGSIPLHKACVIACGSVVKTTATQNGARCYLCVRGGIAVKPFLGSASTHILSGLGGFEGRALKKGDVLQIGKACIETSLDAAPSLESRATAQTACALMSACATSFPKFSKTLHVTVAPQYHRFSEAARHTFLSTSYMVSEDSNRMGIRLKGPILEAPQQGHMTSEGVSLGAIQIPSSGQPIILFVEQQTTGGYPKIANVISADLASLGQLRPRDEIRFELVTPQYARYLLHEQEDAIAKCMSHHI
jgi:antagonist of KipI